MLGSNIKKHFTVDQIYPKHDEPTVFMVSQWQHDKTVLDIKYVIYRIVIFLAIFIPWILSLSKEFGTGKWAIYLTNWGYTLCLLQTVLGVFMTLMAYISLKIEKSTLQHIGLSVYPAYWIITTIATPLAFCITVTYWAAVYRAGQDPLDVVNISVHAINSVLMFIELWIVCHPIRIMHVLYPLALAFIYAIFSVIYYVAGGTSREGNSYIYEILRWDLPGRTVLVCVGIVVFLIILHLFTYLIYKLRVKSYEALKHCKKNLAEKNEPKGYVNESMGTDDDWI